MKLKSTLTTMILFFSISLFSQTSTTVKVTHKPGKTLKDGVSVYDIPNWQPISSSSSNCFSFLSFKVFVKAKSKDELMYKVEASNSSFYSLELDCSKWGLGNGGRRTIKANSSDDGNGASFTSSDFPEITFSEVNFSFPKEVRDNYNVSAKSNNIECGETAESYLNGKKNGKDQTSNIQKEVVINEVSEDQGYQVLDVNTSAYEAEKARKRKLAEANRQQEAEQERRNREYKERKDAFEKEQLAKLNRSTQAYEQRQTNLQNAGNKILGAIDQIQAQAAETRNRERAIADARYEREEAERKAERERKDYEDRQDYLRRERERNAKIAEEKRQEQLEDDKSDFIDGLEHQELPIYVSTKEVYFFIVEADNYPSFIHFAPFKIIADENLRIPYRTDIIDNFLLSTDGGSMGYKLYGPYSSLSSQQNAINSMKRRASSYEMEIRPNINYQYIQNPSNNSKTEKDFWGDKKQDTSKKKPKKKSDSFWDH